MNHKLFYIILLVLFLAVIPACKIDQGAGEQGGQTPPAGITPEDLPEFDPAPVPEPSGITFPMGGSDSTSDTMTVSFSLAELENIGNQTHGLPRRVYVGTTGNILLEDVVLNRSPQ